MVWIIRSIAVAGLAWLLGASATYAQQAGDPRLPSFKDERRFAPRRAPAVVVDPAPALAAPAQKAEPAKAPSPSPVNPPVAAPPPAEAPRETVPAAPPPGLAAPAKLAANACGVPEVRTEPLDAGRMQLLVESACRGGQDVTWTYGGIEQSAKLNASGRLDTTIDAFAGTNSLVELKFADETLFSLPLIARDLNRVTKIAVIWKVAVDLDLHAFEFAAERGKAGHVWSGAPASLDVARQQVQKGPRGAGFLSSIAKGTDPREKVEVYTFLHRESQAQGVVTFAVDHATRGDKPTGEACDAGALAEVPFRIVSTSRGGRPVEMRGVIASAACETPLAAAARFGDAQLPLVRIRAP